LFQSCTLQQKHAYLNTRNAAGVETTALKGWIESASAKLPEKQWRRLAGGGLIGLIVLTGGSVLLRKRSI
jgi:hypothetical protein